MLSIAPRLRAPWRLPFAMSAAVVAGAHIAVTGEHLEEAPYMGVRFILLSAGCFIVAAGAWVHDAPIVYTAGALIRGLAIVGYAATRVVAFPELDQDDGIWLEPLGVVAVLSESAVVLCAVAALSKRSAAVERAERAGQRFRRLRAPDLRADSRS